MLLTVNLDAFQQTNTEEILSFFIYPYTYPCTFFLNYLKAKVRNSSYSREVGKISLVFVHARTLKLFYEIRCFWRNVFPRRKSYPF